MNAFWTDLENRFSELHKLARNADDVLSAFSNNGRWDVRGGNKNSKKQFEWLVEQAAARLKSPADTEPLDFWLNLLKKESPSYEPCPTEGTRRKSELDSDKVCSIEREHIRSEGGWITFLCKASAEYCVRCDTQESMRASRSERTPIRHTNLAKRRSIVKNNLQLTAAGLCELFDTEHIPLPKRMEEYRSWGKAYKSQAFRHSIDTLVFRDRHA